MFKASYLRLQPGDEALAVERWYFTQDGKRKVGGLNPNPQDAIPVKVLATDLDHTEFVHFKGQDLYVGFRGTLVEYLADSPDWGFKAGDVEVIPDHFGGFASHNGYAPNPANLPEDFTYAVFLTLCAQRMGKVNNLF
ncbi:hypothetical protein CMO91_01260 [Candidatus Woesearchaeota archaeon]|nr:hypothetical protein [Candidatus Woesearchaeota archaeon]|tara:strand:- start:144 stop:554 length:411 start_codon:yes stop_codon:yes gene_type:complete